jgi:hypothetical protein
MMRPGGVIYDCPFSVDSKLNAWQFWNNCAATLRAQGWVPIIVNFGSTWASKTHRSLTGHAGDPLRLHLMCTTLQLVNANVLVRRESPLEF